MNYLVPVILCSVFILAVLKRVPLFETFTDGVRDAFVLVKNLLPYVAAIFLAIEVFRISGLSDKLSSILAYPCSMLGIPNELVELIVLKPISGSGSMVALEELYAKYGADSYVGRVGSVISASSDTIVYIVAVYFGVEEDKRSGLSIPISIGASFIGTILACLLCRIM